MPQCDSVAIILTGKRKKPQQVRCKWQAGHPSDGKTAFAFHGHDHGRQLIVWTEWKQVIDLSKSEEIE